MDGDGVNFILEGIYDVGSNGPRIIKWLISISGQDDWENYMLVVMDSEVRALDLFVRKISREASPHGWPIDLNNSPVVGSPVVNDDDAGPVQVIPSEVLLTQPDDTIDEDEDRVCPSNEDPGRNEVDECFPPIVSPVHVAQPGLDCRTSNRVNVDVSGDEETYEAARAANSDDDRAPPPLSPSSIDILQRLFPGRDPLMSDFCDLSGSPGGC
jgi:hypothetical protein